MGGCGRGCSLRLLSEALGPEAGGPWGLYTFVRTAFTTATALGTPGIILVGHGPSRGWAWWGQDLPVRGWDLAQELWEPAVTEKGWRGMGEATGEETSPWKG